MVYKKYITVLLMSFLMTGAAFSLESFPDKDAVLNFEIEGIKVSTPLENIDGILTQHGWKKVRDMRPRAGADMVSLIFVKNAEEVGMSYKSKSADAGYRMNIKINNQPSRGEFSQSIVIERLAPFDLKTYETPRPNDLVHKYAAELKKTVCDGIKDKDEQWNVCSPDTNEQIYLGSGEAQKNLQVRLLPSNILGQLDVSILSNATTGSVIIMHVKRKNNR